MLQLERICFPEIKSLINILESGSFEIENSFSLTVKYDAKNKKCVSNLDIQSVYKLHKDWFNISLRIIGYFTCDELETDDDIKKAHTESYDILFPYAQSMILELTAKGGMTPLILKKIPLDLTKVRFSTI